MNGTRRDLFLGAGVLAASPIALPVTAARAPTGQFTLSVREFGAIGDGQYRPIGDRFTTLAAARVRYPFVSSLAQSIDYVAIQAALYAEQAVNGTVYLPAGRYIINETLLIPSYVSIEGESWWGTVIDNQNLRLDRPQFANRDLSSFIHVTMRNMTGHGGTHFLKVNATASCSYNRFEGLNTNLQSVSDLAFNRLEVSRFNDCNLLSRGSGFRIDVQDFPCNANLLTNVRMTASGQGAIRLRGGEQWLMVGGSIESGGTPEHADITLGVTPYLRGARFIGVYFESGNEFALRTDSVASGIVFDGCHFTGAASATEFAPPRFAAGQSIVEFAGNYFAALKGQAVRGTKQMLLSGTNDGLTIGQSAIWDWRTADAGSVRCQRRAFHGGAVAVEVLSFMAVGTPAQRGGGTKLHGTLHLSFSKEGVEPVVHEARIAIIATLGDGGLIGVSHKPDAVAGAIRLQFSSRQQAGAAIFQVATPNLPDNCLLSIRFEYVVDASSGDTIAVLAMAGD